MAGALWKAWGQGGRGGVEVTGANSALYTERGLIKVRPYSNFIFGRRGRFFAFVVSYHCTIGILAGVRERVASNLG